MKLVADLHIHSHYSRATSKTLDFEHLARWAQLKGVNLVGTGDIVHPGWLQEMRDKLEPVEGSLFRLKPDIAKAVAETLDDGVPSSCRREVRFLLAGEISNIYKKIDAAGENRTRKVHNVIFAPGLDVVQQIQIELEKIGNIRSDGRPILGLDSRDLFQIILDVDPRCQLIPAHIWTPWFSLLGSKSGFEQVRDCFDDLTPQLAAMETGLSSDPPMNWRVSQLDPWTLVSSSDAHSPQKLAREATTFDIEPSYEAMFHALRHAPEQVLNTLEFFPEEGKYHYDGHRKCSICWHPQTTIEHGGLCAQCGKPVTIGVMHRVEVLADELEGRRSPRARPFRGLIPLPEILSEVLSVGAGSKRVQRAYMALLGQLGNELHILLDAPLEDVAQAGGTQLAEGIAQMRRGHVDAQPGYDGEFGVIKVLSENAAPQMVMFEPNPPSELSTDSGADSTDFPSASTVRKKSVPGQMHSATNGTASVADNRESAQSVLSKSVDGSLNPQQQIAVHTLDRPLIITAGPGTGKTRTLTHRIARLVNSAANSETNAYPINVAPEEILAITFTNKAAEEMRERLAALVGDAIVARMTIATFHAFGAKLLRDFAEQVGLDKNFTVLDDDDRLALLKSIFPNTKKGEATDAQLSTHLDAISAAKNTLRPPSAPEHDAEFANIFAQYEAALHENHALDFDDLIVRPVALLETDEALCKAVHARYRWISVDEYQDVNAAQYQLLRLLTASNNRGVANLCVIGDPDQAIYGFRGADRNYFLRFTEDYPDAVALNLTQNYRSTQNILNAAQQVIAQEPDRDAVELWTNFVQQTKLDIHDAPTDKAEAEHVVHQIEQLVGGTSYFSIDSGRVDDDGLPADYTFGDFAVLYRLNAQSRALVEAFARSGIPYQVVGERSLFAYKDVRVVLALLGLLQNPASRPCWSRLLSAGVPFAPQEVARLHGALVDADASLINLLANGNLVRLTKAQRQWLVEIAMFLQNHDADTPVSALVADAINFVTQHASLDAERATQFTHHASRITRSTTLTSFLDGVALRASSHNPGDYEARADRVALLSLHAAKGLEFPVVFLTGCEEGMLPYVRPGETPDIDEERRLFYVGMTRAQHKLGLSHARRRFLFGQPMENAPSRFVDDIERALLQARRMAPRKAKKEQAEDHQLSLFT